MMTNNFRFVLILTTLFLIYNHFTKPYEFYRIAIITCNCVVLSISLMGWDKEPEK